MVVIRPNVSLHAVGRGAAFLGRKPIPPSLALPPGRAGRPVICRCHSFMACLSVRPWTSSLLFFGSAGQTIVLSPVGSSNRLVSFGGLMEKRLVVCRRCAPLIGCWEWGLNEETPTSWGRLPLASSYSPGGPGVIVHSLGRRSGPTLPHCEAKVSGVGFP